MINKNTLLGLMKIIMPIFLLSSISITPVCAETTSAAVFHTKIDETEDLVARSVVKIYATAETYSSYTPWNSNTESRIGTGFIIKGNRILTNAHVVSDHTFIEVQRDGKPDRYEAKRIAVSHEADLALLEVEDKSFFADGAYIPLGNLPKVRQEISVYGFPTGGDTLSVTEGIISRIEYLEYAHSSLSFQAIQIDAAINPGNSGGPALSGGKAIGVAMQVAGNGEENIGYMIPPTMIRHFLDDVKDGRYDGFPEFSAFTEELVNPAIRKKYQLKKEQTGVMVTRVCANSPMEKLLQAGDIITAVDGMNIENNGTIMFQPGKYIDFEYQVDQHQLGDKLALDIIRAGKVHKVSLPLDKPATTFFNYDQKPRYFVFGGFVFTPSKIPDYCLSRKDYDQQEQKDKRENVLITKVLASSSNVGFHDLVMRVNTVNGQFYNDFREFYRLVQRETNPFVILQNEAGYQVVIDRQVALAEHTELLKRYHMEAGQSDDLTQPEEHLAEVQPELP
ncbi:MAG: PDZ domain-containing protein [Thiolinea sp.]